MKMIKMIFLLLLFSSLTTAVTVNAGDIEPSPTGQSKEGGSDNPESN